MRFLLISTIFQPYNSLGAIRMGKLARYLIERGHEVRVLTAANPTAQPTLPIEIKPDYITATRWLNVNALPELLYHGRKNTASQAFSSNSSGVKRLGKLYMDLFHIPDAYIGWLPFATRSGIRLAQTFHPDLIYVTAGPHTALMVAARIARATGIPWAAELRDLWADSHYYIYPAWRKRIDDALERATFRNVAGLVSVSQPWVDKLARKYPAVPACLILNGYDPSDFPQVYQQESSSPEILRLVYTGTIYPDGYEDIRPFFMALQRMGPEADQIRLAIYARSNTAAQALAEQYGVSRLVEFPGLVPYHESLRVQINADVLLLLMWADKNEDGTVPAKMYEYIGARRPILAIGDGHGFAVDLLRQANGVVISDDPEAIALQLRQWLKEKRAAGLLPFVDPTRMDLTREGQYRKLERFFLEITHREVPVRE